MTYKEGGAVDEARYQIVQHTRGCVVELARGPGKWFPHFIAMRERSDKTILPNVSADYWCDTFAAGLKDYQDGSLDAVVVRDGVSGDQSDSVMAEARRALKQGGRLIIANDGLVMMVREGDEFVSWPVYIPPVGKSACVVRYGAIGDTIQATSVLAELKDQGYHITWMSEPGGELLLRHDPRIDAFMVQDKDQVPNHELPAYWAVQAKRFDKWINLCESVEGTLITLPGRASHRFPHALRHQLCDHNYLEITAKIAELPLRPEHRFYASDEETARAKKFIDEIGEQVNKGFVIGQRWIRPFVILWALAGSSVHKTWPHMDTIVARIMLEMPNAHVIFTGDPACQILETGWENEPRVHCTSGKLEIRDALALAQQCDLVIGPETGMLNAVAFESMPKICFLSHSSVENLTKHWVNTASLFTDETPCYPCHQLHYTFEHCMEHVQTGTAMCQFTIPPDTVWDAVLAAYRGRETVNRIMAA